MFRIHSRARTMFAALLLVVAGTSLHSVAAPAPRFEGCPAPCNCKATFPAFLAGDHHAWLSGLGNTSFVPLANGCCDIGYIVDVDQPEPTPIVCLPSSCQFHLSFWCTGENSSTVLATLANIPGYGYVVLSGPSSGQTANADFALDCGQEFTIEVWGYDPTISADPHLIMSFTPTCGSCGS